MWNGFKRLRDQGVMGINQRNAGIIALENNRKHYPLVDNKLLTKEWAKLNNIAVPPLYGVIEVVRQTRLFAEMVKPYNDFVIKPARGSAGKGVLVIQESRSHGYRKAGGLLVNAENVEHHISNILSGMFSLGGQPDQAFIEYRVKPNDFLLRFEPEGMPDFRVVVYRGVPIMAMMRLPTRQSEGKANLHQGAIGIGISITNGVMSGGVWQNRFVEENPFTGKKLIHEVIPDWEPLLLLASKCGIGSQLGYIGVDIVLDREFGPLILELNARPGLSIQLANRQGLLPRIERVQAIGKELDHWTAEQRVEFVKTEFLTPPPNFL